MIEIPEALGRMDLVFLEHLAHTLKGACAHVGAEALRVIAFEVETAAREG